MESEPLDLAALDRLAALERAATPGPWDTDECPHSTKGWLIFGPDGDGLVTCHGNTGYGYTGGPPGGDPETDARALVWLRNHAPALLALARAGLAAQQRPKRRAVSGHGTTACTCGHTDGCNCGRCALCVLVEVPEGADDAK